MRVWRPWRMPLLLRAGAAGRSSAGGAMGYVGSRQVQSAGVARARAWRAGKIGQTRTRGRFHVERDRSVPGYGAPDAPDARRAGVVRAPAPEPRAAADAESDDRTRPRSADAPGAAADRVDYRGDRR